MAYNILTSSLHIGCFSKMNNFCILSHKRSVKTNENESFRCKPSDWAKIIALLKLTNQNFLFIFFFFGHN